MSDPPVQWRRGEFMVSTDRSRIDQKAALARAITNSVCFGVHHGEILVGFGRWLSECMLAHPDLQRLRRVALLTRDAEALYAGVGFTVGPGPLIYMEHRST